MADKNIQMKRKTETGYDNYYPTTKAENVKMNSGSDAETAITAAQETADAALPKSGGTMTGPISYTQGGIMDGSGNANSRSMFYTGVDQAFLCTNCYYDKGASLWMRYDTTAKAILIQPHRDGYLEIRTAPAGANPIVWTTTHAMKASGDTMTGELTVPNITMGNVSIASSALPSAWPNGTTVGKVALNGYPTSYGHIESRRYGGASMTQTLQAWPGSDGGPTALFIRAKRDVGADIFSSWQRVWDDYMLRWNAGNLEYNDGGTWKGVGGVKGVQRGTAVISGTTAVNITISSVNMGKTMVNIPSNLSHSDGDEGYVTDRSYYAELTSATNLRITPNVRNQTGGTNVTISYEVVEFN